MTTKSRTLLLLGIGAVLALTGGIMAGGPPDKKGEAKERKGGEKERQVEEKDVPKAALEALKKVAAGAAITKFEEEVEHGSTFYEGSWKGTQGQVEALVTAGGDLVEIEETVASASVPKAVQAAAEKAAGKDAELRFEKKTLVLYEVKFKKGERKHEIVLTPDGRQQEQEEEEGEHEEDDD